MAKRMLIDATHPEETRVVVLNGNRLEEFDFESSTKKQVKGNIYLAKVTRVEPSLQAAFVDYSNHRHGFLAFSEIHPDYYKIPVGDQEPNGLDPTHEEGETREAEPEAAGEEGVSLAAALPEPVPVPATPEGSDDEGLEVAESEVREPPDLPRHHTEAAGDAEALAAGTVSETPGSEEGSAETPWEPVLREPESAAQDAMIPEPPTAREIPIAAAPYGWEEPAAAGDASPEPEASETDAATPKPAAANTVAIAAASVGSDDVDVSVHEFPPKAAQPYMLAVPEQSTTSALAESESEPVETVETLGGDELEEAEHQRSRTVRHYKIQEVIKRRQIMLVQVTKEERGTKGAALTTYLSLAGRYCVLMPNTARGGGVSRKITSIADRRRLKDILEDLDIPEGMGVIVRTAGAERSKAEIKRDYEYLLRLWNEIRELTLRSTAPALIYEEGNLIKRSIRD
ncbi:MAG TPA: ribonuclease E/G, partial [Stellaceae bacterium]|nr:ribonuclease E/G [Stellaceae bacterium]